MSELLTDYGPYGENRMTESFAAYIESHGPIAITRTLLASEQDRNRRIINHLGFGCPIAIFNYHMRPWTSADECAVIEAAIHLQRDYGQWRRPKEKAHA